MFRAGFNLVPYPRYSLALGAQDLRSSQTHRLNGEDVVAQVALLKRGVLVYAYQRDGVVAELDDRVFHMVSHIAIALLYSSSASSSSSNSISILSSLYIR